MPEETPNIEVNSLTTPSSMATAKPKAKTARKAKRSFEREQSTIGFPYRDLDVGISVAQAILGAGGVPLTTDQLAGVMNLQVGSGNFVIKIATSRIFGLITYSGGKYALTNLGSATVDSDEKRQRAARAEAFLTVPLYRRVYEEFKGRQLPPRPLGLEQAFVRFGVSSKQKTNARLAFDKSAAQAGFFPAGPDRLIEPILASAGPTGPGPVGPTGPELRHEMATGSPLETNQRVGGGRPTTSGQILDLDPLIQGLLSRLPSAGENWETEKRARWLQTLAANFDMVYTTADDKVVVVELKRPRNDQ